MGRQIATTPGIVSPLNHSAGLWSGVCLVLLLFYACCSGVWQSRDLLDGLRIVGLLWFPAGVVICRLVRPCCLDWIEAATLAAAGSLTLTTAANCAISTLALCWPPLQILWPVVLWGCGLFAAFHTLKAICRWRTTPNRWQIRTRIPWMLMALTLGSLIATSRYQRAFAENISEGTTRFILNGDQTYFVSIACELQRGNPPQQHPTRSGVPERAYHHFPHLTLAIAGAVSGQSDLLRLHLVVVYSTLIVVLVLLAFCIARRLSGPGAGLVAAGMIFIAAIPFEPSDAEQAFFYFTLLPYASSTIEPALLTSPQMVYGLVPGMGAILSLLVSLQDTDDRKCISGVAALSAILVALTLKFRVHCFLVLAPTVLGFLVLNAWYRRQWLLLVPAGLAVLLIGLQLAEMRLPVYLPQTQTVSMGFNSILESAPFYTAWPGAMSVKAFLVGCFGETQFAQFVWSVACLGLFCVFNMIGLPMTAAIALTMFKSRHVSRMMPGTMMPMVLLISTILTAVLIRSGYDSFSVGGQIPFHIGWYVFPWMAAGIWYSLGWIQHGLMLNSRYSNWTAAGVAACLVVWQVTRDASPIERKNHRESLVLTRDDAAALKFVRTAAPQGAVILTRLLQPNYALWSGLGGRRAYLDYIPAGRVLDAVLPRKDQVDTRIGMIQRLHETNSEEEFMAILRETHATHIVESTQHPLKIHAAAYVQLLWSSPDRSLRIWEVR